MDFKYLSSYANKEDKGSIKDITARGNIPRSNFGSISSYGKYDNIFDFKTNYRSTQLKKPMPTKKIIHETNDELEKKDTDGKKLGITLTENKSVAEFQDTFIPEIEKKPYVDPQYYQHKLGQKNFYSKFRDKIRRKEAKGGNGEIETEPLSGIVESGDESGDEREEDEEYFRKAEEQRQKQDEERKQRNEGKNKMNPKEPRHLNKQEKQ
jgi:hypothetical protein